MNKITEKIEALSFTIQLLQSEKECLQKKLAEMLLQQPLETLALTGRVTAPLKKNGITTVGQLIAMSPHEVERLEGMGSRNIRNISEALERVQLSLRG